jgi:hypothetical protein
LTELAHTVIRRKLLEVIDNRRRDATRTERERAVLLLLPLHRQRVDAFGNYPCTSVIRKTINHPSKGGYNNPRCVFKGARPPALPTRGES